jgi:hypothetical protein
MPTRRLLRNRREHFVETFERDGQPFTLGVGRFANGEPAEIFLTGGKPGSGISIAARDAAIAVSLALQFGASLETLQHAMTRLSDGRAAGPVGEALDRIAAGRHAGT